MTWIGPALATLGVAGAFFLFRLVFRSDVVKVAGKYDRGTLEARWSRFAQVESLVGVVIVLGVGGGGAVLLGQALHAWVERIHAARPGFVHHLSFRWYYWAITAAPLMFLVLVLGGVAGYKLILRERFEEYRAFGIFRYGFDTLKVASLVVAVILPVGLAGVVLGADAYAGTTEREVVIDDYFGFAERRYGFDRVEAIRERIKEKKAKILRSYWIEFDDDTRWKSEQVEVTADAEPPPFIGYVSKRSGVSIEREPIE